jgi:ubiquinone/menaquinone biosynthesis C-methylase UbiE
LSKGMLAKAEEKIANLHLDDRVQIRASDIRSMPEFTDSQFDMIICEGDPLSYCGDHRAAVREFARILRPGGTTVASVDNRADVVSWVANSTDMELISRLLETGDVLVPNREGKFPYVIHAFTPEELRGLFESNGFAVERILGKPAIARRLVLYKSDDPATQEWLYQLELKCCDDPAFRNWGGHLEIASRKM